MAGTFNDSSPDSGGVLHKPTIKLCHQTGQIPNVAPSWLTPHEHDRFAQLSGDRVSEFLTSRWLIRQALSKASSIEPDLCSPVGGRPTTSACPSGWHLSLSHSHGLSACATQYGSPLGIDIEPSKRYPKWQKVVKRWFAPAEQEWLFQEDDPQLFLQCWTLKEAWLKATGRGIAGNLQTLEVHRNFALYGDRPDDHWQACVFYTEGFLCTLVYRQNVDDKDISWPRITLLEPPHDDYSLTSVQGLDTYWEPIIHRKVHAKSAP